MVVELSEVNSSAGFKQRVGSDASTPKATQTPTRSASNGDLKIRLSF